jgi:prepilin-type processing-associated H-X9-DG protein
MTLLNILMSRTQGEYSTKRGKKSSGSNYSFLDGNSVKPPTEGRFLNATQK